MSSSLIQHDNYSRPVGIGVDDANIRKASGLRTDSVRFRVQNDLNHFNQIQDVTAGTSIPLPATLINSNVWVEPLITFNASPIPQRGQKHLPFAITPCLEVKIANGANITHGAMVTFRLTGLDQMGNPVQETTPWLTAAATANIPAVTVAGTWLCWTAKVFSRVDKIEYMANNIAAGDVVELRCGVFFQPNFVAAPPANTDIFDSVAVDDSGTFWNQGFGLPRPCKSHRLVGQHSGILQAKLVGSGSNDIVSGQISRDLATPEMGLFGPIDVPVNGADVELNLGGFVINQVDDLLSWDAANNKVGVFFAPPSLTIRSLPTLAVGGSGGQLTSLWGDDWTIDLNISTTIGLPSQDSGYPVIDL